MRLRSAGVVAGLACAVAGFVGGCQPADSGSAAVPAGVVASPAPVPSAHAVAGSVRKKHSTVARHHRARVSSRGVVVVPAGVVLPDRSRTPGAVNPAVTQKTIRSTICRTGYTSTIRPSSSFTTSLKIDQLASGYAFHGDQSTQDYEEDHLIALEIGGSPSSPRNLWPEPEIGNDGAKAKDLVENQLHDLVCAGTLSLRAAQHAMATNWWRAYQRYGGRAVPVVFYGSYVGSSAPKTSNSGSATSASGSATARCEDGTLSYSQHRSGTCSHHGGVARWINPPPS